MSEKKPCEEVTITPDRDVLIKHRNNFQKQVLDNVLDLRRHEQIKAKDPNYQRQDPQSGKYIGIDELISNYRKAGENARSYVELIDELLQMEEKGTLAECWAELHLIPSPIADGEEKGDTPKE